MQAFLQGKKAGTQVYSCVLGSRFFGFSAFWFFLAVMVK